MSIFRMCDKRGHELCECNRFKDAIDPRPHCKWCGQLMDKQQDTSEGRTEVSEGTVEKMLRLRIAELESQQAADREVLKEAVGLLVMAKGAVDGIRTYRAIEAFLDKLSRNPAAAEGGR